MKNQKRNIEIKCFSKMKILESDPIVNLVDKFNDKILTINTHIHSAYDGYFSERKKGETSSKKEFNTHWKRTKLAPVKFGSSKNIKGKIIENMNSHNSHHSSINKKNYNKQLEKKIIPKLSPLKKVHSTKPLIHTKIENSPNIEGINNTTTVCSTSVLLTESNNNLTNREGQNSINISENIINIPRSRVRDQRSLNSLDILVNFLDSYRKSDNSLKEGLQDVENNVSIIKNSYKQSEDENMKRYLNELNENLMPKNESRPLFYIHNNQFKFFNRRENHIMKKVQAINKFDDVSTFKFKDIINDKMGFKKNKFNYFLNNSEEKFKFNSHKVVKILENTHSLKSRILLNINKNEKDSLS